MRKLFISLLVASALTPAAALAQDGGFGRGGRAHAERSDSSSEVRPQRAERTKDSESAERPARIERIQDSNGVERAARIERSERPAKVERSIEQVQSVEPVQQVRRLERDQAAEPMQQAKQVRRVERDHVAQPVERARRTERNDDGFAIRRVPREVQSSPETQVKVRRGGDRDGFAIRRVPREVQSSPETQVEVRRDGDRDGFSGLHDHIVQNGDRTDSHHRWSGDWRHDHRYDWRNYRDRHRTIFRIGRYYDPYGWGYRRFSIGYSLWPSYFGSSFWLNDPWQYRLPPAYGPYRWVRYYDDALLVNIYSGEVVDVVYNFFW